MELHLAGRRALVTGGSRGIGRGIVEVLAAEGADILFCGRDQATGETLADDLRQAGRRATFVIADVESEAGIDALADAATHRAAISRSRAAGRTRPQPIVSMWLQIAPGVVNHTSPRSRMRARCASASRRCRSR